MDRSHTVSAPGTMAELSGITAGRGGDIRTVERVRSDDRLDVGEALLTFLAETSGRCHAEAIREAIADHEYAVQRVN